MQPLLAGAGASVSCLEGHLQGGLEMLTVVCFFFLLCEERASASLSKEQ